MPLAVKVTLREADDSLNATEASDESTAEAGSSDADGPDPAEPETRIRTGSLALNMILGGGLAPGDAHAGRRDSRGREERALPAHGL